MSDIQPTDPTWREYVLFTDTTAAYPGADLRGQVPDYPWHGLREEYGELHGVFKRMLRDDGATWTPERLAKLKSEIGDCLWYCARYVQHYDELREYDARYFEDICMVAAAETERRDWWCYFELSISEENIDDIMIRLAELAKRFGWTMSEIAAENMAKLRSRKARGVIQGSGGDR